MKLRLLVLRRFTRDLLGAEWVLFEQSSPMPLLEEAERFMQVLSEFLSRIEASAGS
jgi:L-proline amide hydrolase